MRPLPAKDCCCCGLAFTPTRPWSKYCSTKCKGHNPQKSESTRRYQQKRRGKLNQIKLELGCARCGYNEHPAALHFDHRNPEEKSFTVSQDPKRKWEDIEAEIAKCDVLCANCHSVRTYEQNHYTLRST